MIQSPCPVVTGNGLHVTISMNGNSGLDQQRGTLNSDLIIHTIGDYRFSNFFIG